MNSYTSHHALSFSGMPRKSIVMLFFLLGIFTSLSFAAKSVVWPGIDVLEYKYKFEPLKGKRVGLITNPTGRARSGESTVDILKNAPEVKLVALFGPEHGVYGDQLAGDEIPNMTDKRTGLPVYSLYGETRKPTSAMLRGLDVLVYDIQDIGCRSYTYISTMGLAMEAAGQAGIEFMVLDRPNPLGGDRVEGPKLRKTYTSFVGQWPVPYVYGLTCGELARMIVGEGWLAANPKLIVIPMYGWRRSMTWKETGLAWVPTSPHIPDVESAFHYAMTGWIGELGTVNEGVGYTLPFSLVGIPGISAETYAQRMNDLKLPGVWFRSAYYKPFYGPFKDQVCGGLQIYHLPSANLVSTGVYLLQELRRMTGRDFFKEADKQHLRMFDQVTGGSDLRKDLEKNVSASEITKDWEHVESRFLRNRKSYLLYK